MMIHGIVNESFKKLVHQLNTNFSEILPLFLDFLIIVEERNYGAYLAHTVTQDEDLLQFAQNVLDKAREDKDELDDDLKLILKSEALILVIKELRSHYQHGEKIMSEVQLVKEFFA